MMQCQKLILHFQLSKEFMIQSIACTLTSYVTRAYILFDNSHVIKTVPNYSKSTSGGLFCRC